MESIIALPKMARITFVVLASVLAVVFADVDCNFNVSNLTPIPTTGPTTKKYYINTFFKANWYKAYEFCRYNGMHLASFQNDAEVLDVVNYLVKNNLNFRYWTSGNDMGENRRFVWGSNGRVLASSVWSTGEPNNMGGNEHCAELFNNPDTKSFKINDFNCDQAEYMICVYVNDM